VFLLPSFSEGMPRSLLEAMARAVPCVGAAAGGIRTLLEPKFTFDPWSQDAVESCVEALNCALLKSELASIVNFNKAKCYQFDRIYALRTNLLRHLSDAC
jgi:glycosyltransferase involved in cell wall biosynthesis